MRHEQARRRECASCQQINQDDPSLTLPLALALALTLTLTLTADTDTGCFAGAITDYSQAPVFLTDTPAAWAEQAFE